MCVGINSNNVLISEQKLYDIGNNELLITINEKFNLIKKEIKVQN